MAERGGKKHLLRLEIALFSQNFLMVIRGMYASKVRDCQSLLTTDLVKSNPKLETLSDGALRIESSGSGGAQILEGFCYLAETNCRNNVTGQYSIRFPGLQLFKKGPMERPPGAKKVKCDKIDLSFHSDEDKGEESDCKTGTTIGTDHIADDLCEFLVKRYHAHLIGHA